MAKADEILAEVPVVDADAKSRVDNLPVAEGKRRRGRPKGSRNKVREAPDVARDAAAALDAGSGALPGIGSTVRQAIAEALKKREPPAALSRKGIAGLAKQVARSEVRRVVAQELGVTEPAAGLAREVRESLAEDDAKDALTTDHGQSSEYWALIFRR